MTAIQTPFPHSSLHMSQLVYVPGMPAEPVRYYTTEAASAAPMQPMTILYPSSTPMRTVPTPPQPQPQPQQYPQQLPTAGGASYYVCQNGVVDMGSNNVVYLVPSSAATNAGQMSVLIQSNNSSCTAMPVNQTYAAPQEVYATPQMMQQQQQPQMHGVTYVTMASQMPPKPPQPMMDPATKLALLRSPEVCRHYLNGRCNRRKCRFLHPHFQHPVDPAMLSYAAADTVPSAVNLTAQPAANVAAYGSSLSSSMNSYSLPGAQMSWAAAHP